MEAKERGVIRIPPIRYLSLSFDSVTATARIPSHRRMTVDNTSYWTNRDTISGLSCLKMHLGSLGPLEMPS